MPDERVQLASDGADVDDVEATCERGEQARVELVRDGQPLTFSYVFASN